MIDPAGKETQSLHLEQPKRGRGRPSTGHAMTPAEKQRAYRQRLAEQRASQVPAEWHKADRAAQDERIVQLEQQLAEARKDLMLKQTQLAHWIERAETAERELESRDGKTFWDVESCPKGRRTWQTVGEKNDPFDSREKAEAFAERLRSDKSAIADGWRYRVVQAKAPK